MRQVDSYIFKGWVFVLKSSVGWTQEEGDLEVEEFVEYIEVKTMDMKPIMLE